jgi:hypothetical protein
MDKPRETLLMLKTWLGKGKFDEIPGGQPVLVDSRKHERSKAWGALEAKYDPVWCSGGDC